MAKRGAQLREQILLAAKDVFLEMGFERASMDEVAARAKTSKRSLYAHFESKEKLFLAVIDFVRERLSTRLRAPEDYSTKPAEALVLYCGRYLEILTFEGSIRWCRVCMAEAARFPQGAAQHFDVMFVEVHSRLAAYLKASFKLSGQASADAAQRLLGQVLHPRFPRALFGVDALAKMFDDHTISPAFDLKPIRKAVADLIEGL